MIKDIKNFKENNKTIYIVLETKEKADNTKITARKRNKQYISRKFKPNDNK